MSFGFVGSPFPARLDPFPQFEFTFQLRRENLPVSSQASDVGFESLPAHSDARAGDATTWGARTAAAGSICTSVWHGNWKTCALVQTRSNAHVRQHRRCSKLHISQKASPSSPLRRPQRALFSAVISLDFARSTFPCAQ